MLKTEQSNTSAVYDGQFMLKMFRRVEDGVNPDLEIARFLREKTSFVNVPGLAGSLEYRIGRAEPRTIAIMHEFVHNEGDAWTYTLDYLKNYLAESLTRLDTEVPHSASRSIMRMSEEEPSDEAREILGPYLVFAQRLGERTGELHTALASDSIDTAFAPEPFSPFAQRSLYQSMRNHVAAVFEQLRRNRDGLPDTEAEKVGAPVRHRLCQFS